MEIQKVFSSYDGYEEEKIYSVLMNEEEINLFSEIQKEFTSMATKKRLANELGGMTESVFRGALGKAEGQMFGGYGKWNRDLVSRANSKRLRNMTQPQQIKERRLNRLNNGINKGNIQERLQNFKMERKLGYRS